MLSSLESVESDLSELLELRRDQGWKVKVHHTSFPSQELIAATVALEEENDPTLSHVLLVGSDVSLPMARQRNYRTQRYEKDLPILTDDPYGLPDTTGVPRLVVGRFPTDSGATVKKLVAKTVRYEREIKALKDEVFLFAGRQPADTTAVVGGISLQEVVDNASKAFLEDAQQRLSRLDLRVRSAFPGLYYYAFDEAPDVLQKGFSQRPLFSLYVGHADRDCFATCHDPSLIASIVAAHIRRFKVPEVCGPFISGGCSMLEPGESLSIGEELLFLDGGPVAVIGFTRVNDDFYVMQLLEILVEALNKPARTTLGEFICAIKRQLVGEPQRLRSRLVQSFMQLDGTIPPHLQPVDYAEVVRKNNALFTILGDPTLTVIVP